MVKTARFPLAIVGYNNPDQTRLSYRLNGEKGISHMRRDNDLYKWRMREGLSLRKTAMILGISRVTLLKYENGKRVMALIQYKIDHRQDALNKWEEEDHV